ncbi:M protein trans-acting positive regulator [Enterococcus faecalis]|nr:M protein trans-acting positive regulator [Enterococcus faecalis]EGO5066841.1 M protein trans-acting positive regulator [Enterococcus faecalis]EGO5077221.1 M protein trans-acting positive regulator [Enterococcus faecalis]
MHKEDLFDKHLKNEYLLLKLLYLSSRELRKTEICEKLNITLPTLGKLAENLKFQLEKISSEQLQFLIKRNTIELKLVNNISIDDLTELLLKDSSKYKVFRYLFTYNKVNYVKLENYLQVSGTTLGRILGSCNELLSKYDLKIEHGRIVGSVKQYVFFYYSFFWVSSVQERKSDSYLINELVNEIGNRFSLSIVQREQLFLWILITLKKINKITLKDFDDIDQKNINQCMTTPINRYVQQVYKRLKPIYSEDEVKVFAYLLSLFFVSFGILSYEKIQLGLFRRENPAFEITSKIMAAIKETFILEGRKYIISIETNIFSLIAQTYYFKGANYTTDRLTFKHYYNLFNNPFRERFVLDIIENIIKPSHLFDSFKIEQIKKRLIFLVYVLSPREEYCVKIGVVSVVSHLLTISSISLLKNELSSKQDVIVLPYDEQTVFDLVISNISSSMIKNNYGYFYQLTNLGPHLDIKVLHGIINKISYEKYHSFTV